MKQVARILSFIAAILIFLASLSMWKSHYPYNSLCNIVTPSMGNRYLPLIYPTKNGILGHVSLNFIYTIPPSTKDAVCIPIEPFTPTVKLVGDVLSGAPAYIHGLICRDSVYNYSAFAHLITGAYTEKRAYTKPEYRLIFSIIKRTSTGRLYVSENEIGDINVYISNHNICITGSVKTEPKRVMPTISALIGIPYPIWGDAPDWHILKEYYSDEEIVHMQIRYLELLAYRVEYLSLLMNRQEDTTEKYIIPYLYMVKGMWQEAASITRSNIADLTEKQNQLIDQYQKTMRRNRLVVMLLSLIPILFIVIAYPWETVIGITAGLFIIAISPGIENMWHLIGIIVVVVLLTTIFAIRTRKEIAITLSIMSILLISPAIITITWFGVIPLLKEPSPFLNHLIELILIPTIITSGITLLAFTGQALKPSSSKEQHNHQVEQS